RVIGQPVQARLPRPGKTRGQVRGALAARVPVGLCTLELQRSRTPLLDERVNSGAVPIDARIDPVRIGPQLTAREGCVPQPNGAAEPVGVSARQQLIANSTAQLELRALDAPAREARRTGAECLPETLTEESCDERNVRAGQHGARGDGRLPAREVSGERPVDAQTRALVLHLQLLQPDLPAPLGTADPQPRGEPDILQRILRRPCQLEPRGARVELRNQLALAAGHLS